MSFLVPSVTYLVEVEHQVQFTNIPKECIQNFHEEVYGLEVCQFVVICIDTGAEEQAGVSTVYDLGHIAKLDEVGLVLLIAWRD